MVFQNPKQLRFYSRGIYFKTKSILFEGNIIFLQHHQMDVQFEDIVCKKKPALYIIIAGISVFFDCLTVFSAVVVSSGAAVASVAVLSYRAAFRGQGVRVWYQPTPRPST